MKQFRTQVVIALIVLVCGVSLMGLVYLVYGKPFVEINPGVVVRHSSPVAAPHLPLRSGTRMRTTRAAHQSVPRNGVRVESTVSLPTGANMSILLLSNAKIHNSGSGVGSSGSFYASSSSHRGSQRRGVQAAASGVTMPMTTFVAMASARSVAAPEAAEAPRMAKTASMRNAPPPPPNPTDLEEDDRLVEHPLCPVGDAVLPLLLLAMGWGIYKREKIRLTRP